MSKNPGHIKGLSNLCTFCILNTLVRIFTPPIQTVVLVSKLIFQKMRTNPVKSTIYTSQAVPGTELLFDQDDDTATRLHLQNYQHLSHGDSHILLVPQPSLTDPNDPLKWSSLKKWGTFGNGLAYAFLGAVTGPIMAAWMIPGAQQFNTTLQRMSYANGATLVCQGVATALWM